MTRPFRESLGVQLKQVRETNESQMLFLACCPKTLLLIVAFVCLLGPLLCNSVAGQTETNWRLKRDAVERTYKDELASLAYELRDSGDVDGSREVIGQYQPVDLGREYIFLPGTEFAASDLVGWEAKLQKLKKAKAQRVFELAKNAAEAGAGAEGFQFLNEVLVLDPDHERARAALGHRRMESDWRIASEIIRTRNSTKPEPTMGWAAGSYLRVSTPHFEIHSLAREATTYELAGKLERWHDVWRQVFFEFWSSNRALKKWLDGTSKARPSRKKYQVIFFDSRESYIGQLEPKIKGISASTGYYSDQLKASFFYASTDESEREVIQETWRHELTHQLFQQSIRSNQGPFQDGYVWLGEGIATYFESMLDFGDHVTLGGFDSRRLQFARIRWNRERFQLALDEISRISLAEFQGSNDIRRLYSQSSGMCHMLMNGQKGQYKSQLIEFLKLMYTGKLKEGSFTKIVGLNNASFATAYSDYLRTENATLERFLLRPLDRTEFSLGNPELSVAGFAEIGKCLNLSWLDLSDNWIDGKRLECLKDCARLQQIYLSNCRLENGALSHLARLPRLSEVDLTASQCTDSQFLELLKCSGLESVTITATNISDDAIRQFQTKSPGVQVLK